MRSPEWKQRVEHLKASGYESPFLDRLVRKLDLAQAQASLEQEILQEMASSLGRAEDKVNLALAELAALEQQRPGRPAEREALALAYDAKREEAERCLHELVVTREAVGLRNHRDLPLYYPIPPRRR